MAKKSINVSIIIPTHDRSDCFPILLDSLNEQNYPSDQFEVVVVADGCTDNTVEILQNYKTSFNLIVLEQQGKGAGAARNYGAKAAQGNLLIFLDDDVKPVSGFIQAHIDAHANQGQIVVIGYYPPAMKPPLDILQQQLRVWWEDKFHQMAQIEHRFQYTDLLSGNLSLKADLFEKVGGFDENIPGCGGEDYEFGIQLLKSNIPFKFSSNAIGYHNLDIDLVRLLQRQRKEGQADIMIGRRHPEMRPQLLISHIDSSRNFLARNLRYLLFKSTKISDSIANILRHILNLSDKLKWRRLWCNLFSHLKTYWYWRGALDELGSRTELYIFLNTSVKAEELPKYEIEIDLRKGLTLAEEQLDKVHPNSIRMMFGAQPVGYINPVPGLERLRGVHLRPLLIKYYIWPLLRAIAMEHTINPVSDINQLFVNQHFDELETNTVKNI